MMDYSLCCCHRYTINVVKKALFAFLTELYKQTISKMVLSRLNSNVVFADKLRVLGRTREIKFEIFGSNQSLESLRKLIVESESRV